jgi:hypothetical protein
MKPRRREGIGGGLSDKSGPGMLAARADSGGRFTPHALIRSAVIWDNGEWIRF